jgi:hypothetical protein
MTGKISAHKRMAAQAVLDRLDQARMAVTLQEMPPWMNRIARMQLARFKVDIESALKEGNERILDYHIEFALEDIAGFDPSA